MGIKVTYACGGVICYPDREAYEMARAKGYLGCPACAIDRDWEADDPTAAQNIVVSVEEVDE